MREREKIHRYVDLSNLPRRREGIDWQKSVGKDVYFEYKDMSGHIKILSYNKENGKIKIQYKNNTLDTSYSAFSKGCLGRLLGVISKDFRVDIGSVFKDDKRDLVIIDREYRKNKRGQSKKWYKYTCNNCGWTEGWIDQNNLLAKEYGCSCCSNNTVVPGINDMATTDP